ncbi:MAG: hypothetical protein ACI8P3_002516 [Saprospiraceae bacterium]|jgi:hypothetical protein
MLFILKSQICFLFSWGYIPANLSFFSQKGAKGNGFKIKKACPGKRTGQVV